MESLIPLLVFGMIYAVVHIIKATLPGNEDVEAEPVTEEYSAEPDEYEAEYEQVPRQVIYVEPEPKPKKRTPKRTVPGRKEAVRTTSGAPVQQEAEKGTKKERITIKSGSEAKRAFIYSEIFNRKY
ncbi:MAG: hypothetical protein E7086_04645 [Bacteroidales bacterium]|nr:hypothetical protein [Bacteroidales bacterium]